MNIDDMSHAELTAHRLYDTMHLDNISEEVKRHLIILMLSKSSADEEANDDTETIKVPQSYDEALQMGAIELAFAREDLHAYVDKLSEEYDLPSVRQRNSCC